MLDLLDGLSLNAASALPLSARRVCLADLPATPAPLRPVGYAGPERRRAGLPTQRRLAQLLDALDYGLVLLTDTLSVGHLNRAARRDLDDRHALQLVALPAGGQQVQARRDADAPALREAMLGATQRGLRRLLTLGEGDQRVSLAVVPLPALAADERPGAALLLGRRQVCEELSVDGFARSHALTMAETTVLKGLCADLTPQQIAQRQGVGLATVRTQIGSIRLKTGAGSIRALVRQVALLPPLVGALLGAPAGAAALPARHGLLS